MEIEFKNAIFTDYQIFIKKRKQNISIPFIKIDRLLYAKPTFKNYLLLGIFDCKTVGVLYIYLKEKINNRKKYCFFIKYDVLTKIPKKFLRELCFILQEYYGGNCFIFDKKLKEDSSMNKKLKYLAAIPLYGACILLIYMFVLCLKEEISKKRFF